MELVDPIPSWTEFIQPACLVYNNTDGPQLEPGMEVDVVGMGAIAEGSSKTSDYLEYTSVAIITNSDW